MFKKLVHVTIMVKDQPEAAQFYVDHFGFRIAMDVPLGELDPDARWVTLELPSQPEIVYVLQSVTWGPGGNNTEERSALVGKQTGFQFAVDDAWAAYRAFTEKGVKTTGEPQQFPWGLQFFVFDLYGNMHLVNQLAAGVPD